MTLRFGSLFTGIGGFDKGLEDAGWECAWQVEIDPYCNQVLEKHWPDVPRFTNVDEVAVKNWRLTDTQKQEAVRLYDSGLSCGTIGSYFGVTRQSMWDVLHRRTTMRPREQHGDANHFYRGGSNADDHAQNMVEVALKHGVLVRPEQCEVCHTEPERFRDGRAGVQGHHDDYNKPLDVRWLCQPCHHDWHRTNTPVLLEGGDANGCLEPTVDLVVGGFP